MLKIKSLFTVFLFLSLGLLSATVHAQNKVVVSGPGLSVTEADMSAELQKLPEDKRKLALSKPEYVSQIATGLYVRRAMAAEIEKLKLTDDPVVVAALQAARDRALADMMLARIDVANTPTDEALEKLALSKYRAEPKKYETPPEVNTRHILIRSKTPGALGKAELLLKQLQSGGNFEALAKTDSQDPRSAAKGGEVGFTPRGKMVPPYETAAWALKNPGDMSGIVQTEYGFHIIKLIAKKDAGLRPFDEVKTQIKTEILTAVLNDARKAEAQRLLNAAKFDAEAIEAFASSQQ